MVQSDLSRKVEKASNFVQMVDVLIKDLKLPGKPHYKFQR